MRGQDDFAGVFEAEASAHVFEAAAYCERGRGKDRTLQLIEQRSFEDWANINGRGLQKRVGLLPALRTTPAALDPKHGVAVLRFHDATELHLQLLRAPREVVDFLRL